MSITNYTELQQAVSDNLARTDLAPFIPDFVTMAENVLNYGTDSFPALRCREMETLVSLPVVSGVAAIPDDYLQYVTAAENTSRFGPLNYITADVAARNYPFGYGGVSRDFSIVGSSLYTYPLSANSINLIYYQALPPLASNASNWLLTKAPGVYLRATLMQAADYTKDDTELVKQSQFAAALVAGMNRSDMLGKYSRASLSMRGPTP